METSSTTSENVVAEIGTHKKDSTMTTKTVDIHEAQTHLIQLLEQAFQGIDIVITNDDIPIGRLISISAYRTGTNR